MPFMDPFAPRGLPHAPAGNAPGAAIAPSLPDAVLPPRDPKAPRPKFSSADSAFLPPGHQAMQYMHSLLKDEKELRDIQDLGSPEWFQHQRNVEYFENYPACLKGHPDFDVKREHAVLEKQKREIRIHNQAVREKTKTMLGRIEAAGDRLLNLVELRWAAENHQKITGKPAWGRVDSVPGLEAGDSSWYSRKAKKSIDIRGLTAVGVEREIASIQDELRSLDALKEKLATSERTTPLFPRLDFRSREDILARALGAGAQPGGAFAPPPA